MMTTLAFDCKQAVRALARMKGTTAVAIVILGAAMGLSTAVFSVADAVLFKPLPYPAGDRLVELQFTTPRIDGISLTGAELAAARSASALVEQAEGFRLGGAAMRTDVAEPERLRVVLVTPGFLPMLGARVHGAHFSEEDAAGKGAAVAILTHDYWRTRLGGDPSVIGQPMSLDGEPPVRIIGILDASFVFPSTAYSLLPQMLRPLPQAHFGNGGRVARVIARLRHGVSADAVAAAVPVDPIVRNAPEARISATPLGDRLAYNARRGLILLFTGMLALLVIGILDVAGLLLANATSREREMVTRRALGATPVRIARQLLLEALLIAGIAGTLGVATARMAFDSIMQLVPPQLRLMHPVGIDTRALVFSAAVVVLTTIVFGLSPMLHLGRVSTSVIRAGSGQTHGRRVRRISNVLVTGQVTVAVALVLVGTLLVATFVRIRNTPLGFDADRLAFVSVTLPRSILPVRGEFYRDAVARISSLEEVESVALLDIPPLRSIVRGTAFSPEGRSAPDSTRPVADTQLEVSPEYFATAGLELKEGRLFTRDDDAQASGIVIVNETLAKTWFAGQSAVGQRLTTPPQMRPVQSRVIIGVVEDARHFSLKEEPLAEIFMPIDPARPTSAATFVIRSPDPDRALRQAVAAIRSVAPVVPITAAETGAASVSKAAMAERFYAALLSVSAVTGLALAGIGLYAMLSWSVGTRRRELGLRAALGATSRDLAWGVAGEAIPTVVAGAALGCVAGWWCMRLATALLHGVGPAEPGLLLIIGSVILVISAAAIAVPCRRAFLTSPAEALRLDS